MKKITLIVYFLIGFIYFIYAQIDPQNWLIYKVKVSGLQEDLNDEMLSRTLEKKNQSIFSAFNYKSNEGYIIIENTKSINDVMNFINFEIQKVNIISAEPITFSDTLLLEIYAMRSNIDKIELSKKLPPYLNLGGAKFQFSNDLYAYIKKTWINIYPESYKSLITPQPLNSEQEKELNIKNIKN